MLPCMSPARSAKDAHPVSKPPGRRSFSSSPAGDSWPDVARGDDRGGGLQHAGLKKRPGGVPQGATPPEPPKQPAGGVRASGLGQQQGQEERPADAIRDLKGHWHSAKELRDRRNAAVMRGMRWMHKLLTANRYAALMEVGDDAACLFFEIWYTSSCSTIRGTAKGIALELLDRFEKHLLEPSACRCNDCRAGHRKAPEGPQLFMQLMYLVRCKEEMELDAEVMLQKADELWRECGLSNTNQLFGVTVNKLPDVSDGDFAVLMMHIMVMEFNQILFRRRWPLAWGLREVFQHLRTRTYRGPPYDAEGKFHDAFYFVSHVAFAVSAYSAIRTSAKDLPWLFNYNRRACLYWTKQAWRRISGKQPNRLVDIDGLAEAVDVMRGCGLTDGGDPLLCSATLALLALQRPDGSWPHWNLGKAEGLTAEEPDRKSLPFYSQLHPTWVTVQSLRDRNFEYDRKGNIQWAQFMARLLKETNLRKLENKVVYDWPPPHRKKT